MATYKLSVAEMWSRNYYIVADSPKEAWQKYVNEPEQSDDFYSVDPEFIADMEPTAHIMWDEENNEVDFRR